MLIDTGSHGNTVLTLRSLWTSIRVEQCYGSCN